MGHDFRIILALVTCDSGDRPDFARQVLGSQGYDLQKSSTRSLTQALTHSLTYSVTHYFLTLSSLPHSLTQQPSTIMASLGDMPCIVCDNGTGFVKVRTHSLTHSLAHPCINYHTHCLTCTHSLTRCSTPLVPLAHSLTHSYTRCLTPLLPLAHSLTH
jgi:hypothetical protein